MAVRDWVNDAACLGMDPKLWEAANRHIGARAVAVCNTCPVRRACLLDELEHQEQDVRGPWLVRGGMTRKERRELTKTERRALIMALKAVT